MTDHIDDIEPTMPAPAYDATEHRLFVQRLMTGYEGAHRRVADLCDVLSERLTHAESAMTRALEMQLRLAEEREELISRRHQRELAADAAAARQAAFAGVTQDVRALLPLVTKRLAGIPLTGSDSHGMQDLLTSMTGEQLDTLMTDGSLTLSIGQRQLLVGVLQSLGATEEKEAAE